ncbi:MAG: LysR family transcriptional regulator [Pseudomonadota bacterium]
MIEHLRHLAVFAKVVECGTLRAAAKELNLSPSVVSHHVTQLEEKLGVALLYRSTRKLSLTRDGERLIGPAQTMLQAAEDGINAALDNASELGGQLRVTAPALLARSPLADRIADFVRTNPKVRLILDYSEFRRDMIGEGIDVAIRVGWLTDSQLKARKLYEEARVVIASPDYLRQRPRPETPQDMEAWDWLELTQVSLKPVFRHETLGDVALKPSARVSVNNATALYHLASKGVGLAILPEFMARADMAAGRMTVVLPDWRVDPVGVYVVRPPNSPRDGLAARFIEALAR